MKCHASRLNVKPVVGMAKHHLILHTAVPAAETDMRLSFEVISSDVGTTSLHFFRKGKCQRLFLN